MTDDHDPDITALAELVRHAIPLLSHRPADRAEVAAKVRLALTLRDLGTHLRWILDMDDDVRARLLLASVDEP